MNKSMLTVLLISTILGMMLSQWKIKKLLLFQNKLNQRLNQNNRLLLQCNKNNNKREDTEEITMKRRKREKRRETIDVIKENLMMILILIGANSMRSLMLNSMLLNKKSNRLRLNWTSSTRKVIKITKKERNPTKSKTRNSKWILLMRMKIILMIIHGIKRMLMTGKQRMPTSHSKSTTKDLKT